MFTILKKIRVLLVAVLLQAVLAVFFSGSALSITLISEETELAMGREADKQVTEQFGIYQDKSLQLYVNQIGQSLVSKLSDKTFSKYFFKVVDSSEINAFALPGGFIYVTRGLLAFLNSEAELATVLGHEIGHVIFHHGAQQMVRAIGAQILSVGGAIANPQNASKWLVVSTQLFQQINLGYGREAELEADAQGIVNSYEAGYDPGSIVNFLKGLRWQEIMSGQAYHSFRATHPETKERIIKAETMSSSVESRSKVKLVENREKYLSHLQGLVYGGKRDSKDAKNYDAEYVDIYKVQPGDTFASIAEQEIGDKTRSMEVAILNGKRDTDPLTPGELIKLVKKGKHDGNKTLSIRPSIP